MGETTYTPVRDYFKTRNGKAMGADHPIAWTHEPATGSRFFYTAFDHDLRTLSTTFVCQHILKPSSGRVRVRRCVPSSHHKEKPQRETHAHAPLPPIDLTSSSLSRTICHGMTWRALADPLVHERRTLID